SMGAVSYVLWQTNGADHRDVTVRGAAELGVPDKLQIIAAVSESEDLRTHGRCYIQLDIPGAGPVLAWVGVPGGSQRDGHFIHPRSGRTWPWGELRLAVQFSLAQSD